MDEDRLANQLAETGNIMDLCQDPTWLEETAQIERECGGYVEAGLLLREYAMSPQAVTPDQLQQVRLNPFCLLSCISGCPPGNWG